MARSFVEVLKDQPSANAAHVETAISPSTRRRARDYSQVIADSTRGMDAGQNRFTPQKPDLSSDPYRPDWRGHFLGADGIGKELGDGGAGDGVAAPSHPSPFAHDPDALANLRPDQVPRFFAALTDQDKLPVREVALSGLTAMQNRVDPGKVALIRANGSSKLPVVVRNGSSDYIADGHHRLTAALQGGVTHAQVRFKDITEVSNALKAIDFLAALNARQLEKYSPDQPRDDHGMWTDGGGGGGTTGSTSSVGNHAHALFQQHDTGATAEHVLAASPAGTAEKIAATEHALSQATPTDSPVSAGGFKNPDGTWTAGRQSLHQDILLNGYTDGNGNFVKGIFNAEAVAAATPPAGQQPTITFLGGRGGSGKSWLTGPNGPVDASHAILLNSDHIKEALPGYAGWNAALYHEESTDILAHADKIVQAGGLNVIYDATMRSEGSSAQRVADFKNAGYKAEGYYMFTSPKEAATRAMQRFVRGGTSGRYVPINVILGSRTNEKTFDTVKPSFSRWAVYDNNTPGGKPKLVAQSGTK
jgi:predicted ABC-type ATPase